jgi:hypothetical protein
MIIPSGAVFLLCSSVIFIVLRLREMRTASNLLFLNAVSSDWARGILELSALWLQINLMTYNKANERVCTGYLFMDLFQETFSSWSIAALTYDRYDLLARPLSRKVGAKLVTAILTFIWSFSLISACLPLTGWSGHRRYRLYQQSDDSSRGECLVMYKTETSAFDRFYLTAYDSLAHGIPLILIIIVYSKILLMVRRHHRRHSTNPRTSLPQPNDVHLTITNLNAEEHSSNNINESVSFKDINQVDIDRDVIENIVNQDIKQEVNRNTIEIQEVTLRKEPQRVTTDNLKRKQINSISSGSSTPSFIRSKVFVMVTVMAITKCLFVMPKIVFLELEAFGTKVYPDHAKAYMLFLISQHYVVNSLVNIYWLKSTLRIIGRHGFSGRNATVRFVNRWFM